MSLRVLFIESSVGGVGGSFHSLWTLVSHLNPDKIQPGVLAFQDNAFWDRFRERGIPVEVWEDAGRHRGGTAFPGDGGTREEPLRAPTSGSAVGLTVPDSAAGMSRKAWRRALSGLWRLLREDLPLGYRLSRLARSRRIQILHANDRLGSNRFVTIAGKLSSCPVVQHERLVGPYGWADVWLSGWLAETLCVSSQVAEAVRAMGHRGPSLSVLANAVDLSSVQHQQTVNGSKPRIGVVARLTGWKGQDLFLEAMEGVVKHPSAPSFWVVGAPPPGCESFAASLKALARKAPLAGRVTFTGYLTDPLPTIAGLSVLVVSSRTPEPFGRTILEAMGQGVPVVVPNVGGPAEVVENGQTGLLYPPNDAEALAAAVIRLLDDPALARAMGRRGRQVVGDLYRPEAHARQVEAVYRRLAPAEI